MVISTDTRGGDPNRLYLETLLQHMHRDECRGWRSNPSGKFLQERLTRGTVSSTMRGAAYPSECARRWRWLFGNKIPISLYHAVGSFSQRCETTVRRAAARSEGATSLDLACVNMRGGVQGDIPFLSTYWSESTLST